MKFIDDILSDMGIAPLRITRHSFIEQSLYLAEKNYGKCSPDYLVFWRFQIEFWRKLLQEVENE